MGSWYNGFDLVRDVRKAYAELSISSNEPEFLLFHQRLINFVYKVNELCDYFESENSVNIS